MPVVRVGAIATTVLTAALTAPVPLPAVSTHSITATPVATPVIAASVFVVPQNILEEQTVTMSDLRAFAIDRVSIEVVTATDDVILTFNKDISDSVTVTDVINKMFYGNIDFDPGDPDVDPDPINIADTDAKEVGKPLTDTVAATDTDAKDIGQVSSDSVTSTEAINTKDVGKSLTDTAAATDTVTSFDTSKVVADSASITDAAAKELTRPDVADSIAATDTSYREPGLGKTDSITSTDILNAFDIGTNPSDAVTATDAVSSSVTTVFSDSVEMTDFIAKTPAYEFDYDVTDADADPDPVTVAEVMTKNFGRPDVADTVSATDAINTFAFTKILTETASITDVLVTELILGQTTAFYPDYVSMGDGSGFVQHRFYALRPDYTAVLGGADSLLNSSYVWNQSTESFAYENYTGLIGGPGLLLVAPLVGGEFITYADTSGSGLVVNFHYTDAPDRSVGGYMLNQTPIL